MNDELYNYVRSDDEYLIIITNANIDESQILFGNYHIMSPTQQYSTNNYPQTTRTRIINKYCNK
jgi:hypothetical protein